jgi:MFS transporter, DHA2 family, multidrug resistance protein
MTDPDANTQDTHPAVTTHPLLGIADVLLGALIATCRGRLIGVGLADIRGVLHLGLEGSWINTAFDAPIVGRAAKVLGRRFSSRPTRWQSLTAFFSPK